MTCHSTIPAVTDMLNECLVPNWGISIYAIVGSQEANPMECRISDDSPFGRALLGHSVGEIVEVEAPIGTLRYKILSVER